MLTAYGCRLWRPQVEPDPVIEKGRLPDSLLSAPHDVAGVISAQESEEMPEAAERPVRAGIAEIGVAERHRTASG